MASKTKNKQKSKEINLGVIVLIIVLIIVAVMVIKKVRVKQNENNVPEYSGLEKINMANLENAKIENGEKVNTSEKIQKERELGGIVFNNIKLSTVDGVSRFYIEATNKTDNFILEQEIILIFKNAENGEMARIGYLLPTINAGEMALVEVMTSIDIVNAYDYEIVVNDIVQSTETDAGTTENAE